MTFVFHERVGLDGRRISPFSWRIRYAFAHKGLTPDIRPTRFVDVERVRRLSGQDLVPVLEDGPSVIHDSWAIACHLEKQYAARPSLFGGEQEQARARLINHWCDCELMPPLRHLTCVAFLACVDPVDRAYFRASRQKQFGARLEEVVSQSTRFHHAFLTGLELFLQILRHQPFLCGSLPAYADYTLFSVFQYARAGYPTDVLPDDSAHQPLMLWRSRMRQLFGGLALRFAAHPEAAELDAQASE
jgi:glutathione S-transferase